MNIAIIYSVPTRRRREGKFAATDEDTEESAREVASALQEKGIEVNLVPIEENTLGKISDVRGDLIVNLIEWDGHDLALTDRAMEHLEKTGIPFTGSGRKALILANDKRTMKQKLEDYHLPTAPWQVFTLGNEKLKEHFKFPAIVKLALEHCSVGLSGDAIVKSEHELFTQVKKQVISFDEPVIAEEYIPGREFQVTLLERKSGLEMLPPAEIIFFEGIVGVPTFLTYESRWDERHPDYDASTVRPAQLTERELTSLERLSKKTFKAFEFKHYCRLDIRLRAGAWYILEANANPGLGDDEDYGMTVSYKSAGLTFADFMWEVVQAALGK